MSEDAGSTLGERVAHYRRRLGLSQVELAGRLERSESWVSQVERGVRSVDRMSVLTWLAQVLDVPVADLLGEPVGVDKSDERRSARVPYVDRLRSVLTGHPALDVVLGTTKAPPVRITEARNQVANAWTLAHESRYAELSELLSSLLPGLERTTRAASVDRRREYGALLVSGYLAASAALAKLDEAEGAWVASERAALAAEEVGDPALLLATQYRLGLALLSTRRLDLARQVASGAVKAAEPLLPKATPELLSVWGALHLVLALVAARDNELRLAREHLDAAEATATRVGEGRNDFDTEFGPANVSAHRISVAVEMGNAGEAIDLLTTADLSSLSAERRARTAVDVARAFDQLRRPAEALQHLQAAEALAPEQIRDHTLVRDVVRSLLLQSGRRPRPELQDFADRIGLRK
jgi:transcriptional regulator with XRE-family HTH domain